MRKVLLPLLAALFLLVGVSQAQEGETEATTSAAATQDSSSMDEATMDEAAGPRVRLETSLGSFVIELYEEEAPLSVANFLAYVDSGFFDGTVFHRVIPGFMIQGGGFSPDLAKKAVRPPIKNESANRLKNVRGSLAMARTSAPHSATSQFFVNTVDNEFLNLPGQTGDQPGQTGWGYTVFAKVVEGMETVDAISTVKTSRRNRMENVPVEPVIIEQVSRLATP